MIYLAVSREPQSLRSRRVKAYVHFILAMLTLTGAVACSSHGTNGTFTHRNQTRTPRTPAVDNPIQNSIFDFNQAADLTKDDLSALGSEQFGLPLDMIGLNNDYGSLQIDQSDLEIDLNSDNPNDACGLAQQGLIDRNALYSDQTAYGQDVSLATSDIGRLDQDEQATKRKFHNAVITARRAHRELPITLHDQLLALLNRVAHAMHRITTSIKKDNPEVRGWVVRGTAIYKRLVRACSAAR
jgi:hypothetical protein